MGNVIMKAQQITYGASNVEKTLDDLKAPELIELNKRMDAIDAWKANVHEETYTGSELTIENALALPARSLITEINAIQDLHGLPFPYVGGAYKNKLEYPYVTASSTINGVTFTVNSDGTVKANGTATANCNFVLSNKARLDKFASGTYIMNGCPAGGADGSTYFMGFYAPNKSAYDFGSGTNISLSGNEDQSANIYIRIANGYTANNLIFKPMIRLSTESDASFAPYSNECPISGRTEARVDDVGKNLANMSDVEIGTAWNGASNTARARLVIPCKPSTTYTISINGTNNMDSVYSNYSSVVPAAGAGDPFTTSKTFTTSANSAYIIVGFNKTNISQADINALKLQLEEGSTATSYQPYAHSSATIQLGTTVYGADVNFDTGVASNKMSFVSGSWIKHPSYTHVFYKSGIGEKTFPATELSTAKSNILPTVQTTTIADLEALGYGLRITDVIYVACEAASTAEEFNTWATTNGLQVLYELATPTTIQLTPAQLEMLKGYNRVTIEGGSIELKALVLGGDN